MSAFDPLRTFSTLRSSSHQQPMEETTVTLAGIKSWMARNRLIVAFALVVVAGYTVGKDMALRDNARESPSLEMSGSRDSLDSAA
ncbi:MAG TPA: hypothetical protein VGB55_12215 [Tepidisphaeraceae bacterium]